MPNRPTHLQVERLLTEVILPFSHIDRQMRLPHGPRRFENDAEHSWSVAVLACCLTPLIDPALDVGKVSQLAIAHDLVEVFAGDTSVFADPGHIATKTEREQAALEKYRADYSMFPWLAEIIAEYEALTSHEARFVSAIDKYIPIFYDHLDQGAFLRELKLTKADYDTARVEHRQKAHRHPGVGEYYDQISDLIDQHPEYFHPTT